jgi:hypothetical protein
MAEAVLQRVLTEISVLDQHELRQVQQAVQARLAPQRQAQKRRAFYHALRASGLVRQIKAHQANNNTQRQLVQVQGPPVSQTIIEERRWMADYYFDSSTLVDNPMRKHTGTDFDDFLMDEGILEEVIARAHKRLLTLQLDEAIKVSNTVRLNDMDLLLRETAAWNAASDEDTLKIEDMLTEKN